MAEDERLTAMLDEYWGLPATPFRERQPGMRDKVGEMDKTWRTWLDILADPHEGYEIHRKRVREMWDVFRVARWLILAAPIGLIYGIAELVRLLRASGGG